MNVFSICLATKKLFSFRGRKSAPVDPLNPLLGPSDIVFFFLVCRFSCKKYCSNKIDIYHPSISTPALVFFLSLFFIEIIIIYSTKYWLISLFPS